MDDTFKVRVERIFGCLDSSSAASQSPSSSLWSLTDDEIERNEGNRDKGSPEPESEPDRRFFVLRGKDDPSHSLLELENDIEDLEEDGLEEDEAEPSSSRSNKPDDYNDEEWEIKSSIGRDSTLDYEEEEDDYDKVAVGREKAGDRLYVNYFSDYGIDIDFGNELPSSSGVVNRDPRANHIAAKIWLKEDAEAAGKLNSLPVSEVNADSEANTWVQPPDNDANLKSILKRKDGQTDSKSRKRVRFDPECVEEAPAEAEDIQMEPEEATVTGKVPVPSHDFSSTVPDYLLNPSRYTHYTFNSSSDMDEQTNRQAYMDFLNILKSSNSVEDEAPAHPPKSVMFVPRKKRKEAASTGYGAEGRQDKEEGSENGHRKGFPIGIAAVDDQETEACAMEEDEMESAVNDMSSLKRVVRQYRVKAMSEVDD